MTAPRIEVDLMRTPAAIVILLVAVLPGCGGESEGSPDGGADAPNTSDAQFGGPCTNYSSAPCSGTHPFCYQSTAAGVPLCGDYCTGGGVGICVESAPAGAQDCSQGDAG